MEPVPLAAMPAPPVRVAPVSLAALTAAESYVAMEYAATQALVFNAVPTVLVAEPVKAAEVAPHLAWRAVLTQAESLAPGRGLLSCPPVRSLESTCLTYALLPRKWSRERGEALPVMNLVGRRCGWGSEVSICLHLGTTCSPAAA